MAVRCQNGSASSAMQIGGRKTKEGGRRRCSPRGSRAAARREWPPASTIGSQFILARQVLEHVHRGLIDGAAAYPSLCPTEA